MGIGDLDRRIVIQFNAAAAKNSFGEVDPEDWQTLATVWARLIPDSGSERLRAGAETQTQTSIFRIRHRPGVEPKMRISWRGALYDIESIAPATNGRDRYLDLTATAREVAAGP